MKEYIYKLVANNTSFYIGKTNDPKRRLREHLNDKSSTKKAKFIQQCNNAGIEVTLEVIDEREYGRLESLECDTIEDFISDGAALLNSRGGNTGMLSPIESAKLRKDIAAHKAARKIRINVEKASKGFVACGDCNSGCRIFCKSRAARAQQLYAEYKKGNITLEELKEWSDGQKERVDGGRN